jgi:hypothetical protein
MRGKASRRSGRSEKSGKSRNQSIESAVLGHTSILILEEQVSCIVEATGDIAHDGAEESSHGARREGQHQVNRPSTKGCEVGWPGMRKRRREIRHEEVVIEGGGGGRWRRWSRS